MLLNALARFGIRPAGDAGEQIHAVAATAGAILPAALVAVPRAGAVLVVEAVAITAAAAGTGLMLVGELITGEAAQRRQQVRPPAAGEVLDGHCLSARSSSTRIAVARDMASPRHASNRRNNSGVRRTGVGWARRISSRWGLADCSRRCYGQQARMVPCHFNYLTAFTKSRTNARGAFAQSTPHSLKQKTNCALASQNRIRAVSFYLLKM